MTTYPTLDEARAAGLMHCNCRHSVAAYQEGITRPMGDVADPQGYADTTKLRYLERQTRAVKRVQAAAMDPAAAQAAGVRVRAYQAKIRAHVAGTTAKRQPWRESFGASAKQLAGLPKAQLTGEVGWAAERIELAGAETERAVMRTAKGDVLRSSWGTETGADMSAEMRQQAEGSTLLHNHPGKWARSFSSQDVMVAEHNRLAAIEVVTSDRTLFRAIPGARGWPAEDVVKKTWASVLERETGALDRVKGLSDAEWEKRLVALKRELNHTAMTQLHKDGWTVYTRGKL